MSNNIIVILTLDLVVIIEVLILGTRVEWSNFKTLYVQTEVCLLRTEVVDSVFHVFMWPTFVANCSRTPFLCAASLWLQMVAQGCCEKIYKA